jgi:hypothetical protein
MKKQSVKPTDGYHEELFAGGAISGEGRVSGMASGTANGSFTPGTEYSRPWASIPTASSMGPGNGGGKARAIITGRSVRGRETGWSMETLRKHIIPFFGSMPANDVGTTDIDR